MSGIRGMIGILLALLIVQGVSAYDLVGRRDRYTIYSNGGSYWMEEGNGRRVARFHAGSRDADPRRVSIEDLLEGKIDIPTAIINWFVDMVYNDIKNNLNNNKSARDDAPATNDSRNPRDRDNPHGGAIPGPTRRR